MSDGRISTSTSLQSSVGASSAEELSEKYQKLFSDFSRIKAQHSVLKKGIRKEQATNASLQEECKSKEQELRASRQQLDLMTFHNDRLTKRIQSLQDTGNAKLSTGWLLGSTKKEVEKLKASLEASSIDLRQKIEENEKLHKELFEVNSLFTQHVNVLKSTISELEKKKEELQVELTRAHLASEEAISTIRLEKREVEVKLDDTRRELQLTNALMEKNEQKLKEDDDVLRAELNALRQTLSINLGLADETQSEQFNALSDNIDSESYEIIESFKQLQYSTRDYLNALKENLDSSYELSIKVKNANQIWQKNLQTLAIKFTSAQNEIAKLTAEKELLVKANESDSKRFEAEISRLGKELDKQKVASDGTTVESSQIINNDQINNNSLPEQSNTIFNNRVNNPKDSNESLLLKPESQTDKTKGKNTVTDDSIESEDDEKFVYPVDDSTGKSVDGDKEQIVPAAGIKPALADDDNTTGNGTSFLALERDMSVRKDDDAKQRENLIKKHYECKITQLKEQLQLADGKAKRFHKALEISHGKLTDIESKKSRDEQEISKLQKELAQVKDQYEQERKNHEKSIEEMREYIENSSS